jgi:hypothetical protein
MRVASAVTLVRPCCAGPPFPERGEGAARRPVRVRDTARLRAGAPPMSADTPVLAPAPPVERARIQLLRGGRSPVARANAVSAASLVAPATIFVALILILPSLLLFRYSLTSSSRPVHGRGPDARQLRQVLHRPVLHGRAVADLESGTHGHGHLPRRGAAARLRARPYDVALQERALDARRAAALVGNAVRAAGWMVAFGPKGLLNAPCGVGAIAGRWRSCTPRPPSSSESRP